MFENNTPLFPFSWIKVFFIGIKMNENQLEGFTALVKNAMILTEISTLFLLS